MAHSLDACSPGMKEPYLGCLMEFDIMPCLMTTFCGCIVNSIDRVTVDEREWGWCDCCCGASPYAIRQQIRKKKSYPEARLFDCLGMFCCPCYIYQNTKELGAPFMPTNMSRL